MSDPILQYSGRVPKRLSSIKRRNAILQAALDIINEKGVRGVKHRAVAEKAQVPLSATTYYFEDIDQLIVDSFVYFSHQNIAFQQKAFEDTHQLIVELKDTNSTDEQLKSTVTEIFFEYINQQINDKEARIIERAFLQYASRYSGLALVVNKINDYSELNLMKIIESFSDANAKNIATITISTIYYIEGQSLLAKTREPKEIRDIVEQLVSMMNFK